jgi:hypothetical protein
MFFRRQDECLEFSKSLGIQENVLDDLRAGHVPSGYIRCDFEDEKPHPLVLSKTICSWSGNFRSCLVWVTDSGIWPSKENRHLYFHLRHGYSDHRDILTAPGHYFLEYELADLVTFLDLFLQFGWGAHILSSPNQGMVHVSHDGWIAAEIGNRKDRILNDLSRLSLKPEET